MTVPNIPDVTPAIMLSREDVFKLLVSSIAFEELGLAHLINAEAEKLQFALTKVRSFEELMTVNRSIERTIRTVTKKEMLLGFKLEDALQIPKGKHEHKPDHEC